MIKTSKTYSKIRCRTANDDYPKPYFYISHYKSAQYNALMQYLEQMGNSGTCNTEEP